MVVTGESVERSMQRCRGASVERGKEKKEECNMENFSIAHMREDEERSAARRNVVRGRRERKERERERKMEMW